MNFEPNSNSPFEQIKRIREDDTEYWSARELYPLLDYKQWRQFDEAVKRAKIACVQSKQSTEGDFADVRKIVANPQVL